MGVNVIAFSIKPLVMVTSLCWTLGLQYACRNKSEVAIGPLDYAVF
jgi:hypothetical protein